jgi:hypothetical protein
MSGPDDKSLTDLWRDLGTTGVAWQRSGFAPAEGKAVIEARNQFDERLDAVAVARLQAATREHAQVEHPELAWDAQAAVFTTGQFAEGRAR